MARDNIQGSLSTRQGLILYKRNNLPFALYSFDQAIKANQNTRSIYNAGILSLLYFRDYRLGLKYFKILERHPAKIIAHSNSHIAHCLIKLNRKQEALDYIKLETQVYPISILAHDNKMMLEKELNKIDEANKTANKLWNIFKLKGLSPKDINKIRQNPGMDGRYHRVKGND